MEPGNKLWTVAVDLEAAKAAVVYAIAHTESGYTIGAAAQIRKAMTDLADAAAALTVAVDRG